MSEMMSGVVAEGMRLGDEDEAELPYFSPPSGEIETKAYREAAHQARDRHREAVGVRDGLKDDLAAALGHQILNDEAVPDGLIEELEAALARWDRLVLRAATAYGWCADRAGWLDRPGLIGRPSAF